MQYKVMNISSNPIKNQNNNSTDMFSKIKCDYDFWLFQFV